MWARLKALLVYVVSSRSMEIIVKPD